MPSSSVQKTYLHSNTVWSTSIIQVYLLQWPPFLQYIHMVVVQPSRYFTFYNKNTSTWLGLLWQSPSTSVSISPLKPSLGAIEAIILKPQESPILSITSSYTVIH